MFRGQRNVEMIFQLPRLFWNCVRNIMLKSETVLEELCNCFQSTMRTEKLSVHGKIFVCHWEVCRLCRTKSWVHLSPDLAFHWKGLDEIICGDALPEQLISHPSGTLKMCVKSAGTAPEIRHMAVQSALFLFLMTSIEIASLAPDLNIKNGQCECLQKETVRINKVNSLSHMQIQYRTKVSALIEKHKTI